MHTEDAARGMRRGRGAELATTMNIYLQEPEASLVMPTLEQDDREELEMMTAPSRCLLRAGLSLFQLGPLPTSWTRMLPLSRRRALQEATPCAEDLKLVNSAPAEQRVDEVGRGGRLARTRCRTASTS